ncbi:uncharacterized protein PHALS_07446 [Plasmopara halstedii]|uniref:Uncharacterized protein n=1 Tax=Plasmopara halstedii TaxID=4781 RepID=A0A0P1B5B4_PLAHL|nr:uncharacterized protein PHALS_07446 [Plasmopara halstedii]CEG49694.1 hypothetical protein PHALS_07446 [Plasmopara halstedii]|eukprot:XP_024586063.1 hypothetical protein PHALS_07446 [Plasmopara halstedii]
MPENQIGRTILVSTKTFEDHLAARYSGSIETSKESTVRSCFRPKGEAVILSGKLLELLVEWIIQDNLALSVVDCPYFEALVEGMNPAYRIPSRNTIKARILELMESTKMRMKAWIAEEKSKGKRKRRTKEDTLRSTEAVIQVVQSLVAGQTPEVVTAMSRTLPSLAENTAIAPLLANPNTPVDNAAACYPTEGVRSRPKTTRRV